MKFKIIYKIFALAFLTFVFQSRSNGPANVLGIEVTGAPGSQGNLGTCANAGCHFAGAFDSSTEITLLDGTDAVTEYEPGKSYTVRIEGIAGSGSPDGYGYQAVVLDGADSQAGEWGDVGNGSQVVGLSGRSYAEHNSTGSSSTYELEWVAPAANTGAVTIYAAMALVNGNGTSGGDGGSNASLSISEKDPNSTTSVIREFANISVYPNPVQNELNIDITSRNSGAFDLRFIDISGKIVRTEQIEISTGSNLRNFDVSEMNKGFYLVQLFGDDYIASTEMLKM
jgi:hypothetical protein